MCTHIRSILYLPCAMFYLSTVAQIRLVFKHLQCPRIIKRHFSVTMPPKHSAPAVRDASIEERVFDSEGSEDSATDDANT